MTQMDARDAWVVAAFAGYFAAQAALRIALGGALEVDEAEMVLLARDWELGYGPQLPLYNWIQVAAFRVFGITTAGLAIPKNAVLWLAAAGLFTGLRRVLPFGAALSGALSLAFLPNVVWEFQRASSHSIALLAAVTCTIALALITLERGRRRDWLILGIAIGLGGLTKPNFWMLPVALGLAVLWRPADPPLRAKPAGLVIAGAAALAIVAIPYGWAVRHAEATLASSVKLFRSAGGLPPGIEGLGEALAGSVAGLLPVAVVVYFLDRSTRTQTESADRAARAKARSIGKLLFHAGCIALVLAFVAILALAVSEVQSRWLVPGYCLIATGLFVAFAPATRPPLWLGITAVSIGVLTLAGMAELRANGRATGRIDFSPLAVLTDALAPDAVIAGYHIGGNLKFLRPALAVHHPLAPPPAAALRVLFADTAPSEGAHRLALPYLNDATPGFEVWWRLSPP